MSPPGAAENRSVGGASAAPPRDASGRAAPAGPVERVCVVLLTGLGDVIHGLPVVNALKRAWPGVHITWVVEPMPAPVLHGHPSVDDMVVYHKRRGARGVLDLRRELRRRRFDLTLNLNVYFKSVWPTLLSRAPVRLGFDRGRASDGVWLASNRHLPPRPRAHTQDMFLEFLHVLEVDPRPLEWRLAPTAEERRTQADHFGRFDRPVAAIVPASANAKKDWLPERWARVVDGLEREHGFVSMIVGGPSARERSITDGILAAAASSPLVALGDGIRRLVWLLGGSDLVIAPDTGPVHIARALEVPVIGLYGHTNPWRVGPYGRYHDLWIDAYTEPGEPPDPSDFTPKLGRMETITAEQVLDRVGVAVERYGVRDRTGRRP